MAKNRERALTTAYLETKAELEKILYEEDPGGFGGFGAPPDEYSHEVQRLMVDLKHASSLDDVKAALSKQFESPAMSLISRVFDAWNEFRGRVDRGTAD